MKYKIYSQSIDAGSTMQRLSFSKRIVITLKNIAEDAKLPLPLNPKNCGGKLAGIVEEYTQAIQERRGTHYP